MYHCICFSVYWLFVCSQAGELAGMYGRETVAARQLLGICLLLRDTPIIKGPNYKKHFGVQPGRSGSQLVIDC